MKIGTTPKAGAKPPMIYVLVFGGINLAMVGTAEWIRADRAFMARGGKTPIHFKGSTVPWMLEGGEVEAKAIRDHFAPEGILLRNFRDSIAAANVDLVQMTPEFEEWLSANAQPWDGTNARMMGVKGLGHDREAPPAKATTLAERLARRRA